MLSKIHCLEKSGKLVLGLAALATAVVLPQAKAATQAYTYDLSNVAQDHPNSGYGNYNLGYVFQITQPTTITSIGTFDYHGTSVAAAGGVPVALYYSAQDPDTSSIVDGGHTSGTLVTSVTVTGTSPETILALNGGTYNPGDDGYRYADLASAITLPAGYYEVEEANAVSGFQANVASLGIAAGFATPNHATANLGAGSDSYLTGASNFADANLPGNFGPNFLISTPEPASIGLLALGGLGLLARRRR